MENTITRQVRDRGIAADANFYAGLSEHENRSEIPVLFTIFLRF